MKICGWKCSRQKEPQVQRPRMVSRMTCCRYNKKFCEAATQDTGVRVRVQIIDTYFLHFTF